MGLQVTSTGLVRIVREVPSKRLSYTTQQAPQVHVSGSFVLRWDPETISNWHPRPPFRLERDTVPGTYVASTNGARVSILAQCPAQLYSCARYRVLRTSPLVGYCVSYRGCLANNTDSRPRLV